MASSRIFACSAARRSSPLPRKRPSSNGTSSRIMKAQTPSKRRPGSPSISRSPRTDPAEEELLRYFRPRTVAQLCKPRKMVLPVLSVAALSLAFIPRSQVASALSIRTSELPMSFTISSPGFTNGGDIPKKFTCDDADRSPQLTWTEPPRGTKTFAILVDDPDAPVGNWNHWAIWNLPASLRELAEGIGKDAHLPDGSQQGMNDFHKIGYNGPCPPDRKSTRL